MTKENKKCSRCKYIVKSSKSKLSNLAQVLFKWIEENKYKKKWLALCHGARHRNVIHYIPKELRENTSFFMIDVNKSNSPNIVLNLEVDLADFITFIPKHLFYGAIWCYAPKILIYDKNIHSYLSHLINPNGYLLSAYLTMKKPLIFKINEHEALVKATIIRNTEYSIEKLKSSLLDVHKRGFGSTDISQTLLDVIKENIQKL